MSDTQKEKYQRFKILCTDILAQSGNCEASQAAFAAAANYAQMREAWAKYWQGVLMEVPTQVLAAFADVYPEYKEELNAAGVYYNEDAPLGIVVIGDSAEEIHLWRARNAYILGAAKVVLHAAASATGLNENCSVELREGSCATMRAGYAIARGHSVLTTKTDAECHDAATVRITDATLKDCGHTAIYAYGRAAVKSFTDRLIYLYDNSTLIR